MRRSPAFLGPLILSLAWALQASAADGDVHESRLGNGLKVVVKEDHRAPIVTTQVWYRVGSSYEHGGLTGISHVLEHMMFKGTAKVPPGEFSRIIAENGGSENAFTSRDYTAYFQTLAADRLEVAMRLESDRMRHLRLLPEEFTKEVEVVKEERRMRTDDNPESLTYERFNANAWLASPYRIPTIGWMSDLDRLQVADLKAWYRRWYAPDNATLVVVGDVHPEAVFALARRYYGGFEAEAIPPDRATTEPPQKGIKRLVVKAPAKEPYLLMGYKVPSLKTAPEPWEAYALEMASSILDGGSSARLQKELVRGRAIAASAGADYSLYDRLPSLFLLEANPAKGRTVAEMEQALRAQVRRLREEPVAPADLARIRNQVVAAKVFAQDSVFYQAMRIGMLESVGLGWRVGEEYVRRMDAVTPEQIQAVARKYLTDDRLTVAVLEPLPFAGHAPRTHRGAADVLR